MHQAQVYKMTSGRTVSTESFKKERKKKDSPGLGLSKVQVVDAVEIHVLSVPSERGLPHAKIEVRSVDTLNDDATLLLNHIQQCVEVANVPLVNVLNRQQAFL